MEKIHARAHGKILWLGGYSILERPNPGYVTTVDAAVSASLVPLAGNVVRISAPDFSLEASGKIDPGRGDIKMRVPQELKLVYCAIKAASCYSEAIGFKVSGFGITTRSDKAFSSGSGLSKSGLGSSAAVTVATAAAVLRHFGADPYKDDALHKISQAAHAIATGKTGSGFDIAAAIYGDIIYSRYDPSILAALPQEFDADEIRELVEREWDYRIERLPLPPAFSFAAANFVGGSSATKAMVGTVNEYKRTNPDEYASLIREINSENEKAITALRKIGSGAAEPLGEFKRAFNRGREASKRLGAASNADIEPDDITSLIEQTVNSGAFVAKSPGAGGHDAIAALFLARDGAAAYNDTIRLWSRDKRLKVMDLKRNSCGVEVQ